MQASHVAFINTMIDSLRLGIYGLPPAVLEPLTQAKEKAQTEGEADRTFFNKPQNYMQATQAALDANDACYAKLAMDDTWAAAKGDAATIAFGMRKAAEKCANEGRPKVAAALLVMAAQRAGVPGEHQDKVAQVLAAEGISATELRPALEAASLLLAMHRPDGEWASTLFELGARVGDRHTATHLAMLHNLPAGVMWAMKPLAEYPDLPMGGYKAQDVFHRVNTSYPRLQLISEDPYILICPGFLTPEECQTYITAFAISAEQLSSVTYEEQKGLRTSTTVIPNEGSVVSLRNKIAKLANVDIGQLQITKVTRYDEGQYFRRHTDAMYTQEQLMWGARLAMGKESVEQLKQNDEVGQWPNRYCTCFVYLNGDASFKGGTTTFSSLDPTDQLFESGLPLLGEKLGINVPSRRRKTPNETSVMPKAGMAVLHFPSTTPKYKCLTDPLAYHEGDEAVTPKYIAQQFIWSAPLGASGAPVRFGYDSNGESIQN